ncbi:hypothetical protein [Stutzerimonas kirkiae]|uniref:YqjK-like protein n=1 Tax=Stutzerimonas kirkiae TaxID=2211392 RepID=A0A4Q9RG65_9GAMM|nr:hypothetical protein [Stutzerimonas kirkiae]TBV00053.1 hypothetical protein DNJ96_01865 [Stutzerimonas kirkiae]TBV05759.1 hypothetical protein DNJ95_02535 [Stutzerimonas kirkiae]TBV09554.1 hypothetical protein DNK08_09080 [Stutzerimonas kirkiae]TBV17364.1 hypothetical protein DNK01_00385 [Stutzerimonas kirkiae]
MSRPLSSAAQLQAHKELVRLRMEMNRQQLRYHAQPLLAPLRQARNIVEARREHATSRKPLAIAATIVLGLFSRRLGRVGRLARVALAAYPIIQSLRRQRQ